MRIIASFLIVVLLPLSVPAHPGKTDRHGGHQCLKDCAEWDLYYREYHTHDKDGRPVRVAKQRPARNQKEQAAATAPLEREQTPAAIPPAAPAPAPLRASVAPVEPERPVLSWLLLTLLLLLLLSVRRRERTVSGN